MKPRLVPIVALLAVGGCKMGPGFQRPDVPVPAAYRDAEVTAKAGSLADLPWWKVFEDPTMQALLTEAVTNNRDLEVAAARVEEARAVAGIERAGLYPTVDYAAAGSRSQASRFSQPSGDRTSGFYTVGVKAAWEIDVWGRIRRLNEAALADYFAAEENRRAVLVALVADVAQAYVELRDLDAQLLIAKSTVDIRGQTAGLFTKRLEGGISSRLEVARSAAELASAEVTIPQLEQGIAQQENRLSFLLGRSPGPIPRRSSDKWSWEPPSVPAGIPSELLERRPDVLAAEQKVAAALARIGVAKADFFPRISLTGLLGLESKDLSDLVDGKAATWSIGAGLLGPIFDGGARKAGLELAVAQWDEARASYVKSVQSAFREVADDLVAVRLLRDQRAASEREVAALVERFDLSKKRFDDGLSAYFEVLDAQRDLFPAQLSLQRVKRDQAVALVDLYRALGGGWKAQAGDLDCGCAVPLPGGAPRGTYPVDIQPTARPEAAVPAGVPMAPAAPVAAPPAAGAAAPAPAVAAPAAGGAPTAPAPAPAAPAEPAPGPAVPATPPPAAPAVPAPPPGPTPAPGPGAGR